MEEQAKQAQSEYERAFEKWNKRAPRWNEKLGCFTKEADMEEQAIELPPMPKLPEPFGFLEPTGRSPAFHFMRRQDEKGKPVYTSDQFDDLLHAFARAAVLAERERCARLCDELKEEHMESAAQNNGRQSDFAFGYVNAAEELADAIRSGKPSP
jgi:hypothetical protein